MRFALRNKSKLIKAFGEPFYCELIKCLTNHFKCNTAIESYQIEGLEYQVINVPSERDADKVYQFAITGQMYDVLRLAYYKTTDSV